MRTAVLGALVLAALPVGGAAGADAANGVVYWGCKPQPGIGAQNYGQCRVPRQARSGVTAISAGFAHNLALRRAGVLAWGCRGRSVDARQCRVPSSARSGVIAIAAGSAHSLALKANGGVLAWGCGGPGIGTDRGQCNVPAEAGSGVKEIAAGDGHSLALKRNGSVVAWGCRVLGLVEDSGQCRVPPAARSGVIAIGAGFSQSVALRKNGGVVAWGCRGMGADFRQCRVPSRAKGGVMAISAGFAHNLALKQDGGAIAWGCHRHNYGQCNVPGAAKSGVVAIAAGYQHSLALKDDGSVVAWGCRIGDAGQCDVPQTAGSDVTAIAAGNTHSLALKPGSVVTGAASGNVRYVAPNGSDSNPGTEAQPWRTPQKAMDAMNPGDTTYVKAGTYGRTVCDSSTGDGGSSSGGYVTLKAYAGERPVLTSATDGVLAIDCDYLRVEGLVIAGPGVVAGTLVYGMTDSSNVQIVGNEVHGSICQGIYTEEETSDYEILRNWIHNNGTSACDRQAHGIYLQGDGHLVANNLIHDHPEGFGIQNYDYSRDVIIVGNTITHAGHGGIVVGGSGCGPSGCKVANTVVVGNIVAFNGTYGIDRDSTAPTSCAIHHNLAFQNGSGSYDSGWPSGCLGSNTTADPLFVNVGARNLHLQSGSPAIDAGDPAHVYPPDFDSAPRPQGSAPDIGAFER